MVGILRNKSEKIIHDVQRIAGTLQKGTISHDDNEVFTEYII